MEFGSDTIEHQACVGDRANLYSLGPIFLGRGCVIAQEVYLATGSHDFSLSHLPLMTAKISIGADCFIGARAFVMPGVSIGEGTVIGAMSVVTKDIPAWNFAVGNPCRVLRTRKKLANI